MNINEEKVYEVALESVGGYENYINDNGLEGTEEAKISRDRLYEYAKVDVDDECPREIRFLGSNKIKKIIYKAVDEYDYKTW